MSERPLNLPSFRALTAFWAAATHERLVDAAERLGVTESAISHQIKQLEAGLHVQLFDRSSGRLRLTAVGQSYLGRIEPALREIQAATDALQPAGGRQAVRLTLPPSLAATWLIPRLGQFEAAAPDVEVQLLLTTRIADLRRDQVDLAIRYGRGAWDGIDSTLLFHDLATPVAAPGLVSEGVTFDQLPTGVRIIVNNAIPGEWEEWARARGLSPPAPETVVVLDSIDQALQLALAGHGLAMGRSPYIADRLASGELVTPFGQAGPTGAAYFLCQPANETPVAAARRLSHWLKDAAAQLEGPGPHSDRT
ncbi:MAG: LysR substrate-binding domain-containing protein [Pseudomonadota bacterium]